MSSMITRSTTDDATMQSLNTMLGIMAVVALILLLIARQVADNLGYGGKKIARHLLIAIGPLSVIFLIIAVNRLRGAL
ncbi:MAG: hypothetical protein M3Y58_23190 [Chloroflexota bacterium]|nr:hypothetical protein [Chloroflexota bacterium]